MEICFLSSTIINNPKSVRKCKEVFLLRSKLLLFLILPSLDLLLSYLCVARAALILRIVSLELREFTESEERVWLLDSDGRCSDHNTGSDPPPHARGQTNHQSQEAALHRSPSPDPQAPDVDSLCHCSLLFVVFWLICCHLCLCCTLGNGQRNGSLLLLSDSALHCPG